MPLPVSHRQSSKENSDIFIQYRSYKRYELKDHLGNVRVTVSDSKRVEIVDDKLYYHAQVLSYTDYYPFGMEMVGRAWSEGSEYRQGYNGKENDKDFGEGVQDYGMRVSDTQVARFFSVDPITAQYPELTPYQFASNRPIDGIDLDGLEFVYSADGKKLLHKGHLSNEIRIVGVPRYESLFEATSLKSLSESDKISRISKTTIPIREASDYQINNTLRTIVTNTKEYKNDKPNYKVESNDNAKYFAQESLGGENYRVSIISNIGGEINGNKVKSIPGLYNYFDFLCIYGHEREHSKGKSGRDYHFEICVNERKNRFYQDTSPQYKEWLQYRMANAIKTGQHTTKLYEAIRIYKQIYGNYTNEQIWKHGESQGTKYKEKSRFD
jgi:RHS repeat-associated protein